jgi:ornithine carbamoyltransferase
MPYNLRNRSFLKLLDFSKRDLNHLLNLARDLKRAKYASQLTSGQAFRTFSIQALPTERRPLASWRESGPRRVMRT